DGERSFLRAFADSFELGALTNGLGRDYPVAIEYKAYSCARPIHNAIDCALAIRRQLKEPVASVTAITMRRHPAWAHYHLNRRPATYHEAQVSLPYSTAVALIEGNALLPQYRDDKLGDPETLRLSAIIEVIPDDTLPRGVSCRMTVTTAGGAELTAQVDHPRGSIANPMSPEDMSAKVHMLGDDVIGRDRVEELIGRVGKVEKLPGVAAITDLVVPAAPARASTGGRHD
ncbi:MAG: MmgE/PrpD family protein, partial [Alphaproteobacteria bacterium]|nr:MmgE/PrpD family protein [Alphaproteobacteria bacterium]